MKKIDYASMFTLRSDGRFQGYWHEKTARGKGKRHIICDRDPERLYNRIVERESPPKTRFSDVLDKWEAQHKNTVNRRTWANYAPHVEEIKTFYGDTPIEQITANEIVQDLLAQKAKGYSHTTVNSRRCIWRMALDYAVGERLITYNPALGVKNPKGLPKGKRAAPDETVVAEVIAGKNDLDFGFVPFFLLCTGLRRSEALQLLKSDIDTKAWEISVPKAKTDAGVRTVPVIEPLRDPLAAWMSAHDGQYLFPHRDYQYGRKAVFVYMSDSNWETAWTAYCSARGWTDADGKPTLGAHNLRHGTATLLYEAGVDVYTAQRILGHANVTTTLAIYTDLRKKHEEKNVGKFSELIAKLIAKDGKGA